LYGLGFFCAWTTAAALLPFSAGVDVSHFDLSLLKAPAVLIHAVASFVANIALFVAMVFWVYAFVPGKTWKLRAGYVVFVHAVNAVGIFVLQHNTELGVLLQKSFIALSAVWFVLLIEDVLRISYQEEEV
jgi:hypothetical protein